MSNTRERAFDQMASELDWLQRTEYDAALHDQKAPESPIEEAMLIGLVHIKMIFGDLIFFGDRRLPFRRIGQESYWVQVKTQQEVGAYRVDFLLDCYLDDNKTGSIVIECDGHNFHERTKEQAARDRARDRWLTSNGYTVLRFTGSEIYRDLSKVVSEIINALPVGMRIKG